MLDGVFFCQSASDSLNEINVFMMMCLFFFFSADVKKELDDLSKTMKNFEARVSLAKNLESMSAVRCFTTSRLTDNDVA